MRIHDNCDVNTLRREFACNFKSSRSSSLVTFSDWATKTFLLMLKKTFDIETNGGGGPNAIL